MNDAEELTQNIRRMVCVTIHPQLLEQVLHVPPNCYIMGAEWDFAARAVRVFFSGPDFPLIPFGAEIPRADPIITVERAPESVGVLPKVTWEWNIVALNEEHDRAAKVSYLAKKLDEAERALADQERTLSLLRRRVEAAEALVFQEAVAKAFGPPKTPGPGI